MAINESWFPALRADGYRITSLPDDGYNCIAWAAGLSDCIIDPAEDYFWPPGLPRDVTVETLVALYESYGYQPCSGGQLEPGYEKIAIYGVEVEWEHAARQLQSGAWTSKMGIPDDDIEHPRAESVAGDFYGNVVRFLKRPVGNIPVPPLPVDPPIIVAPIGDDGP